MSSNFYFDSAMKSKMKLSLFEINIPLLLLIPMPNILNIIGQHIGQLLIVRPHPSLPNMDGHFYIFLDVSSLLKLPIR